MTTSLLDVAGVKVSPDHYIDGRRVPSATTFELFSPIDQKPLGRIAEGLVPPPERMGGIWRLSGTMVARIRRTRQVERDFDAFPELAALVADLLEEMDDLRAQIRRLTPR